MGHQNGITSNIVVLSYIMSEKFPDKNIITLDTNTVYTEFENIMKAKHPKNLNMSNLNNSLELGKLNKKYFCDCCVKVKENLYNINAAKELTGSRPEKNKLIEIINFAKEIFDIVIIDNSPDIGGIADRVNDYSDVIINFMKQNNSRFDYLSEQAILHNSKKVINVINEYSEKKGLNIKDIQRFYNLDIIFTINYYENIVYSINLKEPERLCRKNIEENDNYIKQLDAILNEICRYIGFEIQPKQNIKKYFNPFKMAVIR